MKRLLSTTTALSLALTNVQPWPLMAQTLTDDGSVVASDGTVLCQPTEGTACNPDDYAAQAQAIDEARAQAEAEAQAQAEAEAQAQAEAEAQAQAEAEAAAQAEAEAQAQAEAEAAAQAQAEAEAQAQAEAEAQAQAEAEAAAQAEAQAQADAEAAAQAEAEAAAQAEAEAAAAAEEAAAPEEPAADEATAEEPVADEAVTEEPAADEATSDEAVTEEPAADEATAEEPAAEATSDEAVTEEPATDATTAEDPAAVTPEVSMETTAETPATEATTEATVEPAAEPTISIPDASVPVEDAAAGMKAAEPDPAVDTTPVEAPVVPEAQVEKLTEILAEPDAIDPAALGAAATLVAKNPAATTEGATDTSPAQDPAIDPETGKVIKLADQPAAKDTQVMFETLSDSTSRKSSQEFTKAPVTLKDGKKSGLSDLEKVGLVALGALVVGAIINEGRKDERKVVSNTGDRIVVLKPDGTYQVYKDDDAVLRRPGSTVRTETFRDGSTRTIVERPDGTQIVTIRDASGRVLRRAQYDDLGRELVLIDDLAPEDVVVVSKLPKPKKDRVTISTKDDNAALKAALAAKEAEKVGRKFSLRQIREIPEVRALSATIDVDSVTFDSGSAAIKAGEAQNLADLGRLMQDLLEANPGEMFLIEGHTDAVGKAPMNLALSDRRAESVALALTEYFDVPPENMVVQGYGESELLIDTQADERRNRRVVVRVITPLLKKSG